MRSSKAGGDVGGGAATVTFDVGVVGAGVDDVGGVIDDVGGVIDDVGVVGAGVDVVPSLIPLGRSGSPHLSGIPRSSVGRVVPSNPIPLGGGNLVAASIADVLSAAVGCNHCLGGAAAAGDGVVPHVVVHPVCLGVGGV